MRLAGHALLGFLTLSFVFGGGSDASAEMLFPETLLNGRPRVIDPADPLGIRLGTFQFQPLLQAGGIYDDNVFRTDGNKKSDYLTNIRPGAVLQSDWGRHALQFAGLGDLGYYRDNSDQDYRDYALGSAGRYDLMEETYFSGGVGFARRHQSRDGTLAVADDNAERGTYETFSQQLGFTRALSYIKLRLLGRHTDTEITENGDSIALGNNDFIDRDSRSLTTILSYDATPGNGLFVSNTVDRTEFQLPGDFSGRSHGANWRGGINFNFPGRFSGNLFAGYLARNYSDGTDRTNEPYVGGALTFTPTMLSRINLSIDKQFTETTSLSAAGVVRTARRIEMTHALSSDFLARFSLGYDSNDYVGGASADRKADFAFAAIGLDYRLSEGVALRLGYDYRERMSNRENDDYTNNRVLFSIVYNP